MSMKEPKRSNMGSGTKKAPPVKLNDNPKKK